MKLLEFSPPALKKLKTHENSISTYTSETHIKKYLSKKRKDGIEKQIKLTRSAAPFVWKKHCLFCGKLTRGIKNILIAGENPIHAPLQSVVQIRLLIRII